MSDDVIAIFREVFHNPALEVADTMTGNDIEGWDSLQHIKLINAMEERFDIRFKNADLAKMKTVGDFRVMIEKYRA